MDKSIDFWPDGVTVLSKNDGQHSIFYDTKRAPRMNSTPLAGTHIEIKPLIPEASEKRN
jgi:hypothetical protein